MNEALDSGTLSLASLAVSVVILVVRLMLWFSVNRTSSRTNEQIELLGALLDQQKRWNTLLHRPYEANKPEETVEPTAVTVKDEGNDVIRLVAKR